MSDQEVFPVEIYTQIIKNICPTALSARIAHVQVMFEPPITSSPLVESQNRTELLTLSLVSRYWMYLCRCIFYSLVLTAAPEQFEKRNQFTQLIAHPLCTFRKYVKVLLLQDPPPTSELPSFVVEFLPYLTFFPEAKSLCLRDVDFGAYARSEWNRFSDLIFNSQQHSLIFIRCIFRSPELLTAGLAQCSKLYGFHFTSHNPLVFLRPSQMLQSESYQGEVTLPLSFGASVKDLNFSALYPAFLGASTVQTLETHLHRVCNSKRRLQITTFQFHVALERFGEVQQGIDFLAKFISEKLDRSLLSFLCLNVMIFVRYQRDFDDLARSVARLSKLENILLCLIPPRRELENNAFVKRQSQHNRAFIMMMLNSVSSTRLNTVFFLVDSVHNAEDLRFFDWEAIGSILLRPEYAGLESVAFDCTGKTDEWVEEAVTWLDTNVSGHIPPHIVLGVGGVTLTSLISTRHTRNAVRVQALTSKVFGSCQVLISLVDFYLD
ncbi:hypothetical protein DL96DRAFT_1806275 [Flagelloscypha sp. PMI_526]|nr:hypothetical protein DL96DRAFT_1806275 [Flagelloscypha sp. PMI_526]